MTELVTDGSKTVELPSERTWLQLGTAGVGVYLHSINSNSACAFAIEIPLVRIDGVFIVVVSLAETGIKDEYLFKLSVTVPVEIGKVNLAIGSLTSLLDHLARVFVVAPLVVASVVGVSLGNGDRTYNVEGEVELSATLCVEVVVDGAIKAVLVIAHLVGDAVEECIVVSVLKGEVGELHKDDESLLGANDSIVFGSLSWQSFHTTLVALHTTLHSAFLHSLDVGNDIFAFAI